MNVGADFFATMQIPLLLGRDIDERDTNGKTNAAVVNELFVNTFFAGQNPIGAICCSAATSWISKSSASLRPVC
jgi:hypothetical protein